jgi:hypothetical protein
VVHQVSEDRVDLLPRTLDRDGDGYGLHNGILNLVSTPEDLLAEAPLEAAVAALAERNHHHLAEMTPAEREDAIAHWRQIAVAVLTAAGAALQEESSMNGDEGPGRAVIVLEDSGPEEIAIHASFFPQLEDLGGGQVGATPAQAAALELLEQISDDDDPLAG